MRKVLFRIAIALFAIILIGIAGMFVYMSIGVGHAQEKAQAALQSDDIVTVNASATVTTFTGPDNDPNNTYGLVFYQGAKVEADAYAPLLHQLAAQGWVCVIADLPLNFAMLDEEVADRLMADHPEVEHWYVGGHSLGGLVASSYASTSATNLEGLIMLASFTTSDLTNSGLNVISVYGTNDTVLNHDSYTKGLALMPTSIHEVVLEGGNHAQFGDYGDQANDSPATISAEEQVAQTVEAIQKFTK